MRAKYASNVDLVTPCYKAVICVVFERHFARGGVPGQCQTRDYQNSWKKKLSVSFYGEIGRWPCLRLSWSIGHDDAVEVEKEDEFDAANYLFINF